MRGADNVRLITFGNYLNGQSHRVALVAGYDTGMVDAYLDGALALNDHPFWAAGAAPRPRSSSFTSTARR